MKTEESEMEIWHQEEKTGKDRMQFDSNSVGVLHIR